MKNLRFKSITLIVLMVLCVWTILPVSEKLRLAKDLRGGTTLVYSVEINQGENAKEVLDQVIEVLKDRVDPNGTFDITMVAQGQDRIQITMPLPSDKVKSLRTDYEDALAKIDERSIPRGEFERVLRLDDAERNKEFDRIAAPGSDLRTVLDAAASSYRDAASYRSQLELATRTGASEEVLDELAGRTGEAELAYEKARESALDAMPSSDELRRILSLPDRPLILKDRRDGEYKTLPSSRQRELADFREAHDGRLKDVIDDVLAAYDNYITNRTSLDDPSDLVRLLKGAGVLSYLIMVDPQSAATGNSHPEEARLRKELQEKGPLNVRSSDTRWVKINRIEAWLETVQELDLLDASPEAYFNSRGLVAEKYNDEYWVLAWNTPGKRLTQEDDPGWAVSSAFPSSDASGKPAIGFRMNTIGSRLFGDLTSGNIGYKMGVLLDDEVYTAPVINSRITRQGIISGNFSDAEREYITRVLNAGSLQAKLSSEPLSESTIAPELGQDNLEQGLVAGLIAFACVSVFMIVYYFGFGVIAVIALAANALLILSAMSLAKAAFSLPGIAGIILTFGQAVDSNVLIYERVREELERGKDLRTSIKLGFEKALSSIVDGNLTHLIACVVLAQLGTPEIRGFAITLGIGVCGTLFAALFVSRILLTYLTDVFHAKHMRMLPMAVPIIGRVLSPSIQWLKFRWVFLFISLFYMFAGIFCIVYQGGNMLDMEFRGGVQVTLQFGEDENGDPLTMTRAEVLDRVQKIGEASQEGDPLRALRSAEVVPVNPEPGGVVSNTFNIKAFLLEEHAVPTGSVGSAGDIIVRTPSSQIVDAIISGFKDKIDVKPPVAFVGSDRDSLSGAPVHEIAVTRLGDVINRSEFSENVAPFIGGAAIVLEFDKEKLGTLPTLAGLEERIEALRSKSDQSEMFRHKTELRLLKGTEDAVELAVYLVSDPQLSSFDNPDLWRSMVAEPEWDLVRDALTGTTTLASVQTFSPVIAERFKQTAIVAVVMAVLLIVIYIWIRFGSVRYSVAAMLCLVHDVITILGLVALCEMVYDNETLQPIAQMLGIQPFKIDLNLVAALLTIIGFSLNDTIIIMDRIREDKGKLPYASASVINTAVNQTISRTIITSGTTLISTVILYVWGGEGVRAFAFALMMGVFVGTYSSIAVAAPFVWSRKEDLSYVPKEELTT